MTKHWFIAHLIKKFTQNKEFGIDIGIGRDNWSEFKQCKMIGVDRNKNSKSQITLDLESSLPFRNEIFDVAIAINSLNYVENSRKALNEINRVLKIGAPLVCVVDNENSNSHPHVWEQNYLDRVLQVTGFRSILSRSLKDYLYAKWYDKTSVYAFSVVEKTIVDKEKTKFCKKCGKILDSNWMKDELGEPHHINCPTNTVVYGKSYNIETTHPDK